MSNPRTHRRVALLLLATLLSLLVGVPTAGAATGRPATTSQAEAEFVRLMNAARQRQGLAPLASDTALAADARAWSGEMARQDRMVHADSSRLSADTARSVPGWTGGGENIGRGWDVEGLDTAFWNSPTHRDNVLGDFNRVGVGVVYTPGVTWVTVRFAKGPALPAPGSGGPDGDLWLADGHGQVWASGSAQHYGDPRGLRLNQPVVSMVPTSARRGYWLLARDGGVFSYGDAQFFGSTGGMRLNQPVNGIAATRSGSGYWLVASDGGIFAFGDARFLGSTGGTRLARPVNGMAVTPSGSGYWLVASDGGVFAFGDARFFGSAADGRLGAATVGITATPSGQGYWMAASNGRVAAFGDARHLGDGAGRGGAPIVRMQVAPDGQGYWLVASDGTVHPFGTAGGRISGPLTSNGIVAIASAR